MIRRDPSKNALHARQPCHRGFSLIEILVVIALLSVIILGLLLMFNQTQRAFRTGMTQVDVLQGARAATEIIARELSQMTPAYLRNIENFRAETTTLSPLLQPLPGVNTAQRVNYSQDLFFLTRQNLEWHGIGYFVRTNDVVTRTLGIPDPPVGTLYRFHTNYPDQYFRKNQLAFSQAFRAARFREDGASRVLDGIVHFKIRAYNPEGRLIVSGLPGNPTNSIVVPYPPSSVTTGEVRLYSFPSNTVPAFVEFELGILEQRTLERANSITEAVARRNYLQREGQAGRVHVFRLRVPVRNVDPTAYQ